MGHLQIDELIDSKIFEWVLGNGFDTQAKPCQTKDVDRCTYCWYVRWATLIVGVGGMPWFKQAQVAKVGCNLCAVLGSA